MEHHQSACSATHQCIDQCCHPRIAEYPLEIAEKLRNSGIPTEVYYQDKGFKHKMKYANKMGIPYVVIIGEDELNGGNVTVKNMETGEQKTVKAEELLCLVKM